MRAVVQRVVQSSVTGSHRIFFDGLSHFPEIGEQTVRPSELINRKGRSTLRYLFLLIGTVDGEVVSSIGRGLCVLVGICRDDSPKDIEYIVRKILNLRLFSDDSGKKWAKSVMDKQYQILCVSQFTLYTVLKGNKPDFHCAMGGEQSEAFYNDFLLQMRKAYKPELVEDGKFGAYMQVNIQNDGPVTINLESPPQAASDKSSNPKTSKQKSTAGNAVGTQEGAAHSPMSTTKLASDSAS